MSSMFNTNAYERRRPREFISVHWEFLAVVCYPNTPGNHAG